MNIFVSQKWIKTLTIASWCIYDSCKCKL